MIDRHELNQRWMFTAVNTLELQEEKIAMDCGHHDVIVRTKRTGLCGSDMHIFRSGLVRGKPFLKPFVLGHETSGIVEKVGSKVIKLKVGDAVALEPGAACLRCHDCKSGHYAHCEDMRFAAAKGMDGTLQTFYILPSELAYKLPEALTLDDGAMPLAVAVQAVHITAKMRPASNVAVFGAGPVGLLTMAVARALGARNVVAIDVNADRLSLARQFAATHTHLSISREPQETGADYAERHAQIIKQQLGFADREQDLIDVVFECSGAEPCIQTGIGLLRKRGTLIQVGNSGLNVSVPMLMCINRELTVKGSFRYGPGCFDLAIDLVTRGLVDVQALITHKYSWQEATQAFATSGAAKGPEGRTAVKVLIEGPT